MYKLKSSVVISPITKNTPNSLLTSVTRLGFTMSEKEKYEAAVVEFPNPYFLNAAEMMDFAIQSIDAVPTRIHRQLYKLSKLPSEDGFFIVENCPGSLDSPLRIEAGEIPDKECHAAEWWQLTVAAMMGTLPIAMAGEYGELPLQNIVPSTAMAESQSSGSYKTVLRPHGDDVTSGIHRASWTISRCVSTPDLAPYTYMYCMRKTCDHMLATGKSEILDVMRNNFVQVKHPESQRDALGGNYLSEPTAILSGDGDLAYINADWLGDTLLFPKDNPDKENVVLAALEDYFESMQSTGVKIMLKKDCMVGFSNLRGHHARGEFPEGYSPISNTKRHLLRINVIGETFPTRLSTEHIILQ